MMKPILFFLIFLWSSMSLLPLDPEKSVTQYIHESWGQEDGLPQNTVITILQTSDGYLWIGTNEGLVRFDGDKFRVFDKSNTEGLKSNMISVLYEDGQGSLWIGTFGGGLTRMRNPGFFHIPAGKDFHALKIMALCRDAAGNMWVGTDGLGLFKYRDDRLQYDPRSHKLTGKRISSLCMDNKGKLWIGTFSGLSCIDDKSIAEFFAGEGLAGNMIYTIFEDSKKRLWIGTQNGLNCRVEEKFFTFTTDHGLNENRVQSIMEDSDTNLWIGTAKGIHRLKEGDYKNFAANCSLLLDDQYIWSMVEDREGSLWVGTESRGLRRFREGLFTTYTRSEGLFHDNVNCILPDRKSAVWIGTENGLNRIHTGETDASRVDSFLPGITVYSLCRDMRGNLWIGSDRALNYLEFHGISTSTPPSPKEVWTPNLVIRSILEDREGYLWVGTSNGIKRFKDGELVFFEGEEKLSDVHIFIIHQDKLDRILIGSGNGLYCFHNDQLKPFCNKNTGLSNGLVHCIYEEIDGDLWIGTDNGLYRVKNGKVSNKVSNITSRKGLFSDTIWQVLEDDHLALWISSNKGIFRLAKKDVEDFFDGKTDNVKCKAYNEADGMKSKQFMGGYQPAGIKTGDGKLWFPTIRGVVVIEPGNLKKNMVKPPVVIESITADDKKVEITRDGGKIEATIPPGTERIRIYYTALSFQVPDRVRFKTWLEGYDSTWSEEVKQRSVDYTNLSPGDYKFRVIACNNDRVWNKKGTAISIYVQPTFFQTPWFYALCAVAVLLVIFIGYWLLVRQLRKNEQKLRAEVNDYIHDLEERNIELVTLEQAIREINREMNLEKLLQSLLQKAMILFPQAQTGAFFLYDEPTGQFVIQVFENIDTQLAAKMKFDRREGLLLLKHGFKELDKNIYFCPDISKINYEFNLEVLSALRSILTVTGVIEDRPQGMLVLATRDKPITIDAWDVHKLITFREHTVFTLARARTMQNLSSMVEERTIELSMTNELLEKKLDELLRAQDELRNAREKAEQADRVKTRFLTNISHEIRTPMNSILGFSQILDSEITDKRLRGFLKAIRAGGETLMALIDDILDISKIEAGKIQLSEQAVNPVSIVEDIKIMFQREAEQKKLSFNVSLAGDLPELLMIDKARVRQILFNLTGNAIKFTREGSVTLSAFLIEETGKAKNIPGTVNLAFSVKDTGIGIPKEQQEVIFQNFRQRDGLKSDTYGGTGLGLGISRRLTGMMGGTVSVESEENKGSTFTVILPGTSLAKTIEETGKQQALPLKETSDVNAMILVADDMEMNRSVMVELLEGRGLTALEAENGGEVLKLAGKYMPDLIFMDVRMPVMDGIKATRILKQDPKLKDIPVVILTAYADTQIDQNSPDEADDILYKPVSPKQVFEKITKFIPRLAAQPQKTKVALQPTKEQTTRLLDILNSWLKPQWKKVSDSYILTDIKTFAEKVGEVADTYSSGVLGHWARQLSVQIDGFDMQKVAITLEQFPGIINEIEAQQVPGAKPGEKPNAPVK